jgi:hypothetical protein
VTWSFLYVRLCDCERATVEAHSKLRMAQWQTCILSSIYCACSLGWSLSGSLWIGASCTNNVRTVSVLQDASGVPNGWVFSSFYEMRLFRNSFDFFILLLERLLGLSFFFFPKCNQQDATFLNLFISIKRSTCFRRFLRPSSGAQTVRGAFKF